MLVKAATDISETSAEFSSWTDKYIHIFLRVAITYLYLTIKNGLMQPPMEVGHCWIIISHAYM